MQNIGGKLLKRTIIADFLSSSFISENSQQTIQGRFASSDQFRGAAVLPSNEDGLGCVS